MAEFFETIDHGWFEVVDEEGDMGPGMNDTYWQVTTTNVEALRAEVRARLVKALGLQVQEKQMQKQKQPKTRKPKEK